MITRNYFYSGFVERSDMPPDNFDGIIAVKSFFPSPVLAWNTARRDIEKNSLAQASGQQVRIKVMNKI